MDHKLSRDVLLNICVQLDLSTLLSLSLTSQRLYEVCKPLIFSRLHLCWKEIDEIAAASASNKEVDHRIKYAKEILISADSRGEWISSPKLPIIDELSLTSLKRVEIMCALKSSGWLKYISSPLYGVKTLCLTACSFFHYNTFDFDHISGVVPNLETIILGGDSGGFTVDPCCEDGLYSLRHIDVQNCDWLYPSKICDAAANSQLESLKIRINTNMNPFAYSERFRNEFSYLPSSLESLEVIVDIGKRLSWNPLQRSKPLPNLNRARLSGFDYKYEIRGIEKVPKFPKLELLEEL